MATEVIQKWYFGEPTLSARGNAKAIWDRGNATIASHQKGGTGWVAKLVPGTQAGFASAAMVEIPVNEMAVGSFKSATWTYLMSNAELHGVNIGFFIHNPRNLSQRIELNQTQSQAILAKDEGWNVHQFDLTRAGHCFYYEDDTYGATITAGDSNLHSFNEIIQDSVFTSWTIFKIVISHGWYSEGVFDDTYIGEIVLNGKSIPLKPSTGEMWLSDHYIKNDIPISTSIYTPRRIHVKPVFACYTSQGQHGIGHLMRGGYGDTGGGIDLGIGYNVLLEIGADTAVTPTCAIPLNIPLNKIDSLSFLAKMSTDNHAFENMRGISFRIDTDRSGAFTHNIAKTDYYLSNNAVSTVGQDDWELVTPLTDAFYTLHAWHTAVNTPDGTITALQASKTFADFKATDLGDFYVKELLFVKQAGYTTSSPASGDWGMVAQLVINGVEYIFDLDDSQKIQHFYVTDASASISETMHPKTPFRLLGIDIHTGDGVLDSSEPVTITKTSGLSNYHATVIFSEELYVGSRTSYHGTFGKGYEFNWDDKLVIAQANTGTIDVGIDVTYEIL